MRIEKWGFLLSYTMYLVFCLVFTFISKDTPAINSMIFAISLASTAFSISDICFTKIGIDKKERKSIQKLYSITNYAQKYYKSKIKEKYGEKAEKMISLLMELFDNDENLLLNFFEGKLVEKEKEVMLSKIKAFSNDELTEFVTNFLKSDNSEISEMIEEENNENQIYNILNAHEKKEKIYLCFSSSVAIIGLTALLIVLTIRINVEAHITNMLTIVAFLFIIINLLLKEYYKTDSLKRLEQERIDLLNDLKTHSE